MKPNAKQVAHLKAREARRRCCEWLLPHISDGKAKVFKKDEYRQLAVIELGVSKSAFDEAWIAVIEDLGRHDWYEPRPRRRPVDVLA